MVINLNDSRSVGLTFKVEVDVCVAVPEGVEGVASVHAAVGQAGVLDGERQHEAVLLQHGALVAYPLVLLDALEKIKEQDDNKCSDV